MEPSNNSTLSLSSLSLVEQPKRDSYCPNKPTPINALPIELLNQIFKLLSLEDLIRVGGVSKQWRALAKDPMLWKDSDLKRFFPLLTILGQKFWEKHVDLASLGLSFADFSNDNRSLVPHLRSLARSSVEGNAGITLLTMPKGLSLLTIEKLAKTKLKEGSLSIMRTKPEYYGRFIDDSVTENRAVEKTYQVILSNSILENSRELPKQDHQRLVKEAGGEIPEMLPVATQIALTLLNDPDSKAVYSDPFPHKFSQESHLYNLRTLTRCAEEIASYNVNLIPHEDDKLRIYRTAGVYAKEVGHGFAISSNYYVDYGDGHQSIGVGVMKKIEPASE